MLQEWFLTSPDHFLENFLKIQNPSCQEPFDSIYHSIYMSYRVLEKAFRYYTIKAAVDYRSGAAGLTYD